MHLLQHKNLDCTECSFKTKTINQLEHHMLKHRNFDEVETFNSTNCSYKTKRLTDLEIHCLQRKSLGEVEIFDCTE